MNSENYQQILYNTMYAIANSTVSRLNIPTIVKGSITYVDPLECGYKFKYNNYEYPAYSANTGYKVKDNVIVLFCNNDTNNNVILCREGTHDSVSLIYDLPIASPSVLGGVKIGDRLKISDTGVLTPELRTQQEVLDFITNSIDATWITAGALPLDRLQDGYIPLVKLEQTTQDNITNGQSAYEVITELSKYYREDTDGAVIGAVDNTVLLKVKSQETSVVTADNTEIFSADVNGISAHNANVDTQLLVGPTTGYIRFETFSTTKDPNQIGIFYIGGES